MTKRRALSQEVVSGPATQGDRLEMSKIALVMEIERLEETIANQELRIKILREEDRNLREDLLSEKRASALGFQTAVNLGLVIALRLEGSGRIFAAMQAIRAAEFQMEMAGSGAHFHDWKVRRAFWQLCKIACYAPRYGDVSYRLYDSIKTDPGNDDPDLDVDGC